MAYTVINFRTKKALKEFVIRYLENKAESNDCIEPVRCYQPGLGPDLSNFTGSVALEGPHYPAAHSWYAAAELKDGIVVNVK